LSSGSVLQLLLANEITCPTKLSGPLVGQIHAAAVTVLLLTLSNSTWEIEVYVENECLPENGKDYVSISKHLFFYVNTDIPAGQLLLSFTPQFLNGSYVVNSILRLLKVNCVIPISSGTIFMFFFSWTSSDADA